jgi:predicted lipoprotein with Yx(FWY)xxD motif
MNGRKVMPARSTLVSLLALAAACGGGSSNQDYGTPAQPGEGSATSATLTIATDARLGGHLVDGNGRSLYYFAKDVPASGDAAAVSRCDASCLPIWPVFSADNVVAEGIDATDVGEITRSDGSKQRTYKGFPLYYYAGDTAAGDTRGEGVDGTWYVVHDPNYSITQLSKADEASTYLTDAAGRALYTFDADTVGTSTTSPESACASAQCVANWPVFISDPVTVPSDLVATDFTVYTRTDGMQQSAYKGHPLYHYAGDAHPGETNGRNVPRWHTIDPHAL